MSLNLDILDQIIEFAWSAGADRGFVNDAKMVVQTIKKILDTQEEQNIISPTSIDVSPPRLEI